MHPFVVSYNIARQAAIAQICAVAIDKLYREMISTVAKMDANLGTIRRHRARRDAVFKPLFHRTVKLLNQATLELAFATGWLNAASEQAPESIEKDALVLLAASYRSRFDRLKLDLVVAFNTLRDVSDRYAIRVTVI